jgi:RNA 2',3'-cyclic 3'-phosphodiesterase
MRLFIAVELPEEIKNSIELVKESFKPVKGLRFVSKDNIHITLKFLGEINDEKVPDIISALADVHVKPFKLLISKLGVFPNENNMRVLWVDAEPAEPLSELKKRIDAALPGSRDDHPFKNHITIARITTGMPEDMRMINELVMNKNVEKKEFIVRKFILFKSTLTPDGPIYSVVKQFS